MFFLHFLCKCTFSFEMASAGGVYPTVLGKPKLSLACTGMRTTGLYWGLGINISQRRRPKKKKKTSCLTVAVRLKSLGKVSNS